MALFKPKGKHAQGAHAQPVVIKPEETEEKPAVEPELESAPSPVPDSQAAAPESIPSPVPEPQAASPEPVVDGGQDAAPSYPAYYPTADEAASAPAPMSVPAPMPTPEFTGGYGAGDFGAVTVDGVVLHKKRNVGKVVGIVFGVIIGLLLIAYIVGAVVFMGRFFPNTKIGDLDISMMPNEEVASALDKAADSYTLDVVGNGFNYKTTAKDINLSIDSQAIVDAMHANLSPWAWPVLIFQNGHDESDLLTVTYDKKSYETKVTESIETYNKDAVAPVDATIAYDDKTKKFKVVAEVPGTQYDSKTVLAAMADNISSLQPSLKLTSDHLVQPKVFSTDERLVNSAELATGLVQAHVTLTMVGQVVAEIDGNNLSPFIRMDENMGVTLDEAGIDQWVTDLSNGFDTVGTERTYTRPDGKVITISGGAYGWLTDAPALKDEVVAAIKAGQTTTIDIPCQQTAFAYNGPGQPDWTNRYIDVDLSEQYVRFYGDDGSIIWESACISGTPDGKHNTWPGVWYITNKESPSKLIGYTDSGQKEYETTVSFWMAFEGNGIGLHDATWQPSFGGDMYASGYGSHGCVNLSYSAAESLYGICNVGDVVIAHY